MSYELQYEGEWEDEPWIYQYSQASSIHLDDDLKVWDSMGRKESFAVATLLWDFYDNKEMYGGKDDEDESLSIDVLWGVLNDQEVRDMKDVYDAFSNIVPQATVDEIFVNHGFFWDENGDRKHDESEVIGFAANGGAFLTEYDFDKDGIVINPYDVNTTVGEWLLGGNTREAAPITAYDDVPRWGSADIDGDGDIASLVLSADGDSYESAVVDKDKDGDFGPLTDLDGDGEGEMTENPFWVLPFDLRRSMMEFPEEMIELKLIDKTGAQVPESFLVMTYEYEEPFAYRNYQTRALVDGNEEVSIWVPEKAVLTIRAEARRYKSEDKMITHDDFLKNLAPRSNQGKLALSIPATADEIAEAIKEETKERETDLVTEEGKKSSASDDADDFFQIWMLILVVLVISLSVFFYKTKRR
jgi:hypothetical protein